MRREPLVGDVLGPLPVPVDTEEEEVSEVVVVFVGTVVEEVFVPFTL